MQFNIGLRYTRYVWPMLSPAEGVMLGVLLAPKFIVLYVFIASAIYTHSGAG